MNSFVKVARRQPIDIFLSAEALFFLILFRIGLRLLPFRRILRSITRHKSDVQPVLASPDPEAYNTALRVRWAVEAVSRNAPAGFVCFPQALAAYSMLRRRGISSTIVYGVGHSHIGKLIAHAWLTLGDRVVVGREGFEGFQPIERWT